MKQTKGIIMIQNRKEERRRERARKSQREEEKEGKEIIHSHKSELTRISLILAVISGCLTM
jgi:hypothetical protein